MVFLTAAAGRQGFEALCSPQVACGISSATFAKENRKSDARKKLPLMQTPWGFALSIRAGKKKLGLATRDTLHGSRPNLNHRDRRVRVGSTPLAFWLKVLVRRDMWSSGEIRDKFPGFPLFDFHVKGKIDIAACSEIFAHSSQQ